MSRSIHSIARHFLNKDSLDQCTIEEVRGLAEKHPYASAIQFLLLEKLRSEDHPAYEVQAKKSILYYHDPLGFQYFLHPARFVTELPENEQDIQYNERSAEDLAEPKAGVEPVPEEAQSAISEPGIKEDEIKIIDASNLVVLHPDPIAEPEKFAQDADMEEEKVIEFTKEEDENVFTAEIDQNISLHEPVEEAEEYRQVKNTEPELTLKPITIPNAGNTGNDLVFDPYHTVDYFASQGIKLSQDEFSKDKFGKQLKSFTEWLKSMKRLPANQVEPSAGSPIEDKVLHLAEDSIHQSEVYTEAMADVWLKQGNKAKAIEVYNKLSLLNPSKKAYFATQIENLKQS